MFRRGDCLHCEHTVRHSSRGRQTGLHIYLSTGAAYRTRGTTCTVRKLRRAEIISSVQRQRGRESTECTVAAVCSRCSRKERKRRRRARFFIYAEFQFNFQFAPPIASRARLCLRRQRRGANPLESRVGARAMCGERVRGRVAGQERWHGAGEWHSEGEWHGEIDSVRTLTSALQPPRAHLAAS